MPLNNTLKGVTKMETEKRIIEVNGLKMEVDLRHARIIENYKVGDYVKVLIKDYNSYSSFIGCIIGFDNFEKTPTVVIAYLKTGYNTAHIEFLYYNSKSEAEITCLNEWDIPVTKSEVISKMNEEITKKQIEIKELESKKEVFEKLFGKYFDKNQ